MNATPDSLLADLPEAVCVRLRERLPRLRECAPHPGKFDLDEIKRFTARLPAVRVTALNLVRRPQDWVARMAAFVVTQDAVGVERSRSAMAIIQAVLSATHGSTWGLECLGGAERVAADNLYSGDVSKASIALWAVSWDQPLRFPKPEPQTPPVLTELYLGAAPNIGAGHEDDYIQILGGSSDGEP